MLKYTTASDGARVHAVLAGNIISTACGRDLTLMLVPGAPTDWATVDGARCGACLDLVPA